MPPMTTPHASPPSSSPHLTAASPHLTSSPVLAAHPTSSDRYLPRPTFSPTSPGPAPYHPPEHLGQRPDTISRMAPRQIQYSSTNERPLAPSTSFTRLESEYQRRGGAYARSHAAHGMGAGGIPFGARFPYGLGGGPGAASTMEGAGSAMQDPGSATSPPPGAHGLMRQLPMQWPESAGGSGTQDSRGQHRTQLEQHRTQPPYHRTQPQHHRTSPGQQTGGTDIAWLEMLGLQGQHDPGGRRGG
ncbi:hypothetical protein BD626DRAFT_517671 [Schizophyllum amplum]|uniref:Uncharacterized protein n=1 Tax=Schizophyllum amplum TaxID=97359 RepID=A0A550BW46_9AGAR|nr:hypothetical protein BD626DRAFT_517671 [Auriculariopsis ampla]